MTAINNGSYGRYYVNNAVATMTSDDGNQQMVVATMTSDDGNQQMAVDNVNNAVATMRSDDGGRDDDKRRRQSTNGD